ncbi:MAG TPA: hypothetical protein VK054_04165 [Beutenbergiaceae bacterium]|nr:hypothetical protein [Beutenbergiaceae bacterium]
MSGVVAQCDGVIVLVSHGGARNRSGPAPVPGSARSEARGLVFQALPNEGFRGEVPVFPLGPGPEGVAGRELEVWGEVWGTPQAAAWALESWRWPVVAEYCRLKAIVEVDPSASAALVAQLHRYRDQIGLTPAGLRENGWAIAQPEVVSPGRGVGEVRERPKRRMRAV